MARCEGSSSPSYRLRAGFAAPKKEKRQTQVSEAAYRKQISKIFKQSRYEDYYDSYGRTPEYVEELEKICQTAVQFLEAGDA